MCLSYYLYLFILFIYYIISGITKKLDHFVDLGIETLYLSPFYKSPMTDMGYDISDFLDVDNVFGTMNDFDELMREMKSRSELSFYTHKATV